MHSWGLGRETKCCISVLFDVRVKVSLVLHPPLTAGLQILPFLLQPPKHATRTKLFFNFCVVQVLRLRQVSFSLILDHYPVAKIYVLTSAKFLNPRSPLVSHMFAGRLGEGKHSLVFQCAAAIKLNCKEEI